MAAIKLADRDFAELLRGAYAIRDAADAALAGATSDREAVETCKAFAAAMLVDVLEPKAERMIARMEYAKKRGL